MVTDLDGTFWDRADDIHPAHVAAWKDLERRGVHVIVATGRRVTTTRDPLAAVGIVPHAIVLNGALAIDFRTRETFHRTRYDVATGQRVLAAFRAAGLDPCVYVEHADIDVYVGAAPSTHPAHLASFGGRAVQADLDAIVATVPVLSFGIIGHPHAPLAEVVASIGDDSETHLLVEPLYGETTLNVVPVGISKWAGVLAYCAKAGLDPARVLAAGDGPNDRELLDHAAVAVVPSTGGAEALAAADHVIPPPSEGGWAEILDLV
ncbi:MAG: Hydrolase superfamily [Actinomycetia bacterium]|nr:Hydrolase superfamily [Actinomycetes bacterium]